MFRTHPALSSVDWSVAAEALERGREFVLTTHVHPDTDGIGSQIALYRYLWSTGRSAHILNSATLHDRLQFLDPTRAVRAYTSEDAALMERADTIIVLDVNELHRLGGLAKHLRNTSAEVIVIDHHANETEHFGTINIIEPAAASTGMLVYDLLVRVGAKIDRVAAQAIYATIVADTGSFRFSNTSADVMRIAADLIELGANPQEVYRGVLGSYTPQRFQLLSRALGAMQIECDGALSWLFLSSQMLEQTGADERDVDGLIEYLRLLRGVRVTVLLLQVGEELVKLSLRSEEDVDVNLFASRWGGGGHVHAAGATISGTPDKIVKDVVAEAVQLLK